MEINGFAIPLKFKDDETRRTPDLNELQEHIEWLEKIDQVLQIFHAKEDLKCEILSDKEGG